MAIRVKCPGCGGGFVVPGDRAGQTAICEHCGELLEIPIRRALPDEGELPLTHTIRTRPRKTPLATLVSILVQAAITGTTLYIGYRIISKRLQPVAPRQQAVKNAPANVEAERPPRPPRIRHAPIAERQERPARRVDRNDEPPVAEPRQDPPIELPVANPHKWVDDLPRAIALPAKDDRTLTTIASLPNTATLFLISNSKDLFLIGDRITFQGDGDQRDAVAGLRVNNGNAEFRWDDGVPAEAERQLRNSLVLVSADGQRRAMALRTPVRIAAPTLDLRKSVFKISSKCDSPPDVEHILADFTPEKELPAHRRAGDELVGMSLGKTARLHFGENAAIEVRAEKLGQLFSLRLESRFELPSGDVEPLTISRGNRKINELESLSAAARTAPANLSRLRSRRSHADRELSVALNANTWRSLPGGGAINDPTAVAAKSMAIGRLQREIVALNRDIDDQEQLVRDAPAIATDLQTVRLIAELSQQLRKSKLPHRFYTRVGEHEVDLIVAE